MPVMSFFYLDQFGIPFTLEITGTVAVILLESFIFYRIARIMGLEQSTKPKSIPNRGDVSLDEALGAADRFVTTLFPFLIPMLLGAALVLDFLTVPLKLGITVGVVLALLWSYGRYYLNMSKDPTARVERTLAVFLELFFLVAVLILLELTAAIITYFGAGLRLGISFAVLVVGPIFSWYARTLVRRFEVGLSNQDFTRIGPAIVRYLGRYLYSLTVIIVVFSDIPAFYSFFSGGDVSLMILWALGYTGTAFSMVIAAVYELTSMKVRIGILTPNQIAEEISRASKIGFLSRIGVKA
jgi:hypothetical protein